jgi:hypothetical protein
MRCLGRGSILVVLLLLVLLAGAGQRGVVEAHAAGPCSSGTFDGSFSTTPASGSILPGETDCYTLSGLSASDSVLVATSLSGAANSSPNWAVVDGDGSTVCGHYVNSGSIRCHLSGSAPWSLWVFDGSGGSSGTFSYSAVVRRLTNPQGCSSLGSPGDWSFTSPRIDGSIDGALDSQCFTFSRSQGEADGLYWLRTVRAAGDFQPVWTVYGPTGSEECNGSSGGVESGCKLLASGQFALVVRDQGGDRTGSYFVTAKRLNAPSGCGTFPSVSYGAAPSSGSIATAGEADCYLLPDVEQGDAVSVGFNVSGVTGANTHWTLLDGNGAYVCDSSSYYYASSCVLGGAEGWSLVVFDYSGSGTFSYSAAVRRLNDPQGCSPLGDPAIWSFAAGRINGTLADPLAAQCYTFSRAVDEPDGNYWFRAIRSSGGLAPEWKVYGPGGSLECAGTAGSADSGCKLLAAGKFSFVVKDQSGTQTGAYLATAKRLTIPVGCSTLPSISFGAAPLASSIASAGEADCYSLPNVDPDDAVAVGFTASGLSNASPRWTLVDGTGSRVCDSDSYGYYGSCALTGAAGWSLLIYDAGGSGTFSYSTAVRRLTDPQGCSPLGDPAIWSFTAPRSNGAIGGPLDARCFTFSRAFGEPDANYWFRTLRTSGQLQPEWSVYGPTGSRECRGSSDGVQNRCRLQASDQFAFVVADQGGSQSGSYFATSKRLTGPSGCAPLPSVAFGISVTKGNLSTAGEVDCYALSASAGDLLKFTSSGSADQLALVDPEGEVLCMSWSTCVIDGDGQFSVLLYSSSGASSGTYQFEATCENVPCGQSNTAVTDATPNRVGSSRFASVLLRGRDLELLDSASLSRGGQTRAAEVGQPSPDGRAVELRFDLDGAALGSWDLTATFIDGTVRTLPGAVTVEALKPARMSVEMVGRPVFRPGLANPVTLEVTNEGNVDGLGVPLILGGIPQGAQVQPMFELQDPAGSFDSPQLEKADFEQDEDTVLDEETGTVSLPLLLSRVPAGRTVRFEYQISVPVLSTYQLEATAGQCLATELIEVGEGAAQALTLAASSEDPGVNCIAGMAKESIAQALLTAVEPNKTCMRTLSNAATDVIARAGGGASVTRPRTMFSWLLGGASCAVEVVPLTKVPLVARRALKLVSAINRFAGRALTIQQCMAAGDSSRLEQRGVNSIDPNDILGPVGSGPQRYISGSGPLGYQVLFENLPAATAPAQRIEITDQLDPALFNLNSVLFQGVSFGGADFTLPVEEREIDQMIDLRPGRDLLAHLKAEATGAGLVRVVLQAIDPETLAPPDDPSVGLLPPNTTPPEGEGHVSFSVKAKAPSSGQVLTNSASIVFDGNTPITTPVWSNTIDKAPPAPTVSVGAGATSLAADVSWGGSDDAAGIVLWRLEVSRGGGPYELWMTASVPGTVTYSAPAAGNYAFRAIASDGAGNVGQSSLVGISLADGGGPGGDGGGAGGGGGSAATAPAATASTLYAAPTGPPPLRCRKGFRRKTVKGKARCVKGKPPRRHRSH